jgi:hypothetical protein
MTATLSRRGFIGAAAAFVGAGLVPSWRAFKQRRAIDLTPFCDDYEGGRYSLTQPFAQEGMVYACDARICVRTLLAEAPELSDETRLPPCSSLPWWMMREAKWQKWPKLKLFGDGEECMCPICLGRGGLSGVTKCVPCQGTGYTDIEMTREEVEKFYDQWDGEPSYEMPCKGCRGTGWQSVVLCDYCDGKGWTRRPGLLEVGDAVLAGHYDARIRAMGDVEFCLPEPSVIRFRGDGFEGLVMGIDLQKRKELKRA